MQKLKGKTIEEIVQNLNRSPRWVSKWWKRYQEEGWSGLKERSRKPNHHPHELRATVKEAIWEARIN